MKFCVIFLLLFAGVCKGQEWQAELMLGAAGYSGDLTQKRVSLKQLRPVLNLNLKYNSGNLLNFRAGIAYTRLVADDQNNNSVHLTRRNLNFRTDVIELNVETELNLFDPQVYTSFPYLFAGVGGFYFNPFTYDKNHTKTYLQPLSTEGEGLSEYPSRKKYSLFQFCIPLGVGWRANILDKWDVSYEFGYRILFTDYLDDVSKTYVNLDVLADEKGPKAAELSYRGTIPFAHEGKRRGNSSQKDMYFFTGVKIATSLSNIFSRY